MLCLCSLYLPPQQFSNLRLSGRAEHSQLDQGHPPVCGLCFDNQRCVCSCWLLHIHWLHSRYGPEAVNYTLETSSVMRFLLPFSGDIFENYCRYDNLATFGRFCFGLSIVTTFPLECFVTREVKEEGKRGNTHKRMSPFACSVSLQVVSNVFCCRELTRVEHAGLTVLIVTVCTSLSLAFECLGVVLELNVSCCFHGSVAFNDCSWPCFPDGSSSPLSHRAFWVPLLWSSSFHPRASSNSPLDGGFRVKTRYRRSWFLPACLSWSPV